MCPVCIVHTSCAGPRVGEMRRATFNELCQLGEDKCCWGFAVAGAVLVVNVDGALHTLLCDKAAGGVLRPLLLGGNDRDSSPATCQCECVAFDPLSGRLLVFKNHHSAASWAVMGVQGPAGGDTLTFEDALPSPKALAVRAGCWEGAESTKLGVSPRVWVRAGGRIRLVS
jgi:hypothetical protein